MSFVNALSDLLTPYQLLSHPYYEAWNSGKLTRKNLQTYATQYFHHVDAFPRYVSAIHSQCGNIQDRQALLENLIDEERGPENHPELWLRFVEGMGAKREDVRKSTLFPETQQLVDTFFDLTRASYTEGLAALFAYERQIPEIARVKIEGLKKFYQVRDDRTLAFFCVHQKADVYHSQTCAQMMEKLPKELKPKAKKAALKAAKSLWKFLDGVYKNMDRTAAVPVI